MMHEKILGALNAVTAHRDSITSPELLLAAKLLRKALVELDDWHPVAKSRLNGDGRSFESNFYGTGPVELWGYYPLSVMLFGGRINSWNVDKEEASL